MTKCEVEGKITIKDADKNEINTLNVVARLSEPMGGGGGGGGGSGATTTESEPGVTWIIDDVVAAKQAAIGSRFSGQPTEAMKAAAKVCMSTQAQTLRLRQCWCAYQAFRSRDINLTAALVFVRGNATQRHKLRSASWLADPSNIQLIESNVALDAEATRLKVGGAV